MIRLSPPMMIALPIVEFASYFIIITQVHKFFMDRKISMIESSKIKNFISSTSLSERKVLKFQDDLLSNTMIVTCLFGILIIGISCYLKKTYSIDFVDITYNDTLETHLFITFCLTLFFIYFLSSKIGFYIYTIGMTLSLLLYVLINIWHMSFPYLEV